MKKFLWPGMVLSAIVVSGCGGREAADATEPTPEPTQEVVVELPEAVPTQDLYPGWATYANADYGFTFRYPPTWTLQESPNSITLTQDTKSLIVGYKRSAEAIQITGTGTAAGDFQPGSAVTFLGTSFTTNLLALEDKTNTVYYGSPNGEITAGDLVFSLSLVDNATDPAAIDLSPTIQSEAAQILGSFTTGTGATAAPQQDTVQPAQESGTEGLPAADPQPAAPQAAGDCQDSSDFVSDITVPDGTEFAPGESFIKTWRLINNGTCTWTTGYQYYYVSGEQMATQTSYGFTRRVAPGETFDLSVEMVAPDDPGQYTAFWNLLNTGGSAFGAPYFVTIVVADTTTPTPDPNATPGPTPTAGSGEACVDDSEFVTDVTVPDGSQFAPGAAFTKTWRVMNSGTCTWGTGYQLVFQTGTQMAGVDSIALGLSVPPGQEFDISVDMTAPSTPGSYTNRWRLTNPDSVAFGTFPFVEIVVSN